jgi:replicative DNA helicase
MSSVNGLDVAQQFLANIVTKPERWLVGEPFEKLDFRPGQVVTLTAPPGAAKTTLAMQIVYGLLENQPNLKCVVTCADLKPQQLFRKFVSRLAGVRASSLRDGVLTDREQRNVKRVVEQMSGIWARITFCKPPWTVESLQSAMNETQSQFAVVDYIQRFDVTTKREIADDRTRVKKVSDALQLLTHQGAGFLVVAAMARQKDNRGQSSYEGGNLASLGDTKSLDYNTDDCYLLTRGECGLAELKCLKKREWNCDDPNIHLRFEGEYQAFFAADPLADTPMTGFGPTTSEASK